MSTRIDRVDRILPNGARLLAQVRISNDPEETLPFVVFCVWDRGGTREYVSWRSTEDYQTVFGHYDSDMFKAFQMFLSRINRIPN